MMSFEDGYTLGAIFARGGSKGVPRKNVRLLAGKPLIAYAIETALASDFIDRVIVSTDDLEIAEVARNFGAEVPFMRPSELSQDDSPEWLAWRHVIQKMSGDTDQIGTFVCIPPTSPMRSIQDVDDCIRMLLDSDADVVITVTPARRNPHFNMVVIDKDHRANLVIPSSEGIHRRQSAPRVYDVTTIAYAARPEFIMNNASIFEGKVKAVVVPEARSLDIDTELDFQFAEFLMRHNQ
jgi:CMP-N-acetylneuraminic acid synthetase